MANNFLPFCPTDSGTNLLTQSEYAAAADRTSGNQPGIASSKLNNKAIRQSSYVVSQLAQYMADKTGASILDDAIPAKLLAQINAAFAGVLPVTTKYTTGSGTWNMSYRFYIATGSATVGATYTNNSVTFTVVATVASALEVQMTGNGDPSASGTLTKASGTGDATITFYAFRKPTSIRVRLVGGGGGGGASGTAGGGNATNGGDTTFGSSLLTGSGGALGGKLGGAAGGAGGAASLGTGPVGIAIPGGSGGGAGNNGSTACVIVGGQGGSAGLGGGGGGGGLSASANAGQAGATNSGGGGGGAGTGTTSTSAAGGGGGAGGFVDALITSPSSSYAYGVGAGGSGGTLGTNGAAGGAGAAGIIIVQENY